VATLGYRPLAEPDPHRTLHAVAHPRPSADVATPPRQHADAAAPRLRLLRTLARAPDPLISAPPLGVEPAQPEAGPAPALPPPPARPRARGGDPGGPARGGSRLAGRVRARAAALPLLSLSYHAGRGFLDPGGERGPAPCDRGVRPRAASSARDGVGRGRLRRLR